MTTARPHNGGSRAGWWQVGLMGWLGALALVAPVWAEPAIAVAVLSPQGLPAWAGEATGLELTALTPEQMADPAVLSAAEYPVALLEGAEDFIDTVTADGDAADALMAYVGQGGSLLVLSQGRALSRPLRRVGAGWVTEPSPLRHINLLANLGLLDADQTLFQAPPSEATLRVVEPAVWTQQLDGKVTAPADLAAWRFLPTEQIEPLTVTPLAELVGTDGQRYGAALALVHNQARAQAGRVVYGWSPLVTPALAGTLLSGLARWGAAEAAEAAAEQERFAGAAVHDGDAAWQDNPKPVVALQFNKGVVYLELWPEVAPKHVSSFESLIGKQFYDGIFVHRVEPGFVVQAGDPLTKEVGGAVGPGIGSGGPGYTIDAEFNDRPHLKGTLAMARSQEVDSAGSQFYICLDRLPGLDGNYTVFGQVLGDGMAIVDRLAVGDRIVHGWVVKPTAR